MIFFFLYLKIDLVKYKYKNSKILKIKFIIIKKIKYFKLLN